MKTTQHHIPSRKYQTGHSSASDHTFACHTTTTPFGTLPDFGVLPKLSAVTAVLYCLICPNVQDCLAFPFQDPTRQNTLLKDLGS